MYYNIKIYFMFLENLTLEEIIAKQNETIKLQMELIEDQSKIIEKQDFVISELEILLKTPRFKISNN